MKYVILVSLLLAWLGGLGIITLLAFDLLGSLLDDTDGNGLLHVSDSESSKWRVGSESLNAHWLCWDDLNHSGFTRLDELWILFKDLEGSLVDLGDKLAELAGNVGSVAIKNWGVSSVDLTWVVHDNNLGEEHLSIGGWIVFAVRGNITSLDVLD